jgi:hypothetical protein
MKKINVKIQSQDDLTHNSLQIWDFFYSYRQYLNRHNNYDSDVDIRISSDIEIEADALNVGWYHMPNNITGSECFDLIIVDANQHHFEVSTECMYNAVKNNPKCFYVTGSYVDKNHELYNKLIITPMTFNTLSYFVRPFYPQYYEKDMLRHPNQKNILYINGQNRSNRQYFIELLQQHVDNIDIKNSLTPLTSVEKLLDSFFETDEDSQFREFVNSKVRCSNSSFADYYYSNSIKIGVEQKFGAIPPGYFMLDEYYQYQCIVFPETTWLNNEIFVTEKTIKCCIAECIPFPVGGANTHKLYNQLGYFTAWNLLPDELRSFDNELDHIIRYQQQVEAVAWLTEQQLWQTSAAQDIIKHNKNFFFSASHDNRAAEKLNSIIESLKKWQQI